MLALIERANSIRLYTVLLQDCVSFYGKSRVALFHKNIHKITLCYNKPISDISHAGTFSSYCGSDCVTYPYKGTIIDLYVEKRNH